MQIRRMRLDDAAAVARLFEQVVTALPYYNDRAKQGEMSKYGPSELRTLTESEPDSVLVAEIDGELAGFCISRYDDGVIWLSWFGVREDKRSRGIGSALLSSLEQSCAARRCHKIWCDTRVPNERSAHLLQKAGFSKICELTNHWYGQDFYLWEKPVLT